MIVQGIPVLLSLILALFSVHYFIQDDLRGMHLRQKQKYVEGLLFRWKETRSLISPIPPWARDS